MHSFRMQRVMRSISSWKMAPALVSNNLLIALLLRALRAWLRRYLSHAEVACKVSVGIYLSHKNTFSLWKGKRQMPKKYIFCRYWLENGLIWQILHQETAYFTRCHEQMRASVEGTCRMGKREERRAESSFQGARSVNGCCSLTRLDRVTFQ